MSRTDAISPANGPQKSWATWIATSMAIAVVAWAAQRTMGPSDAFAQAPIRGVTSPRANQPNARTSFVPQEATGPSRPVVAEVNNERITRIELGRECLKRHGKQVLESTINRKLIWQACQERRIQVSAEEIEKEIDSIAKRFRMDVKTWLAMLKKERGISAEQYRSEIIWSTLALRRLAAAQLVVTKEEVNKALESEFGPKVRARIISVTTKTKADELLASVRKDPAAFADIAKKNSEDGNSASAGGLIPPIRRHIGDPKVEEVAFALKDGEISDVLFVANQYIIIKCDKQVSQTYLTPAQLDAAKERATAQLRDHKMRTESAKIFQDLERAAKVVHVFGDAEKSKQYPNVAALINGRPMTLDELAEQCIVRHGEEVLEIEINRRLLNQALQRGGKTVSRADIDSEIARAADAYGYVNKDGSANIQEWLKEVSDGDQSQVDVYVSDAVWPSAALKQLVNERINITEEDLKKGYEANFGERVQVLAIMLNSRRDAQKVWEMARNNATDDFFGELASQYSIEPVSKANFGRVPPIRRHSGQKNMEEEAFRLQPGELSELIVVGSNYLILRCLGRTKPMVRLDEVRDDLHKDLFEKKLRLAMNDTFDKLKQGSRINNFLVKKAPSRGVVPASATQPRSSNLAPIRRAAPR